MHILNNNLTNIYLCVLHHLRGFFVWTPFFTVVFSTAFTLRFFDTVTVDFAACVFITVTSVWVDVVVRLVVDVLCSSEIASVFSVRWKNEEIVVCFWHSQLTF